MRTSTIAVCALAAAVPAFAAPTAKPSGLEARFDFSRPLNDVLGDFLGPLALERRQSQEDVDRVSKQILDILFSKREIGTRQAQEDVDKVAKQLIDIIFSKRELGARFDFSRPLNDVLGDFLGPLALERRDLSSRQAQEDVDKVAKQLIDIIFSKRELGTRQAQEDVDKVAKQLIDIIFSKRDLGARFDFSRPLNDVLGDFLGPLALERRDLSTRQAQEDVDKVAKQLIDIIFSKRDLGARFDFSRPLNDVLGDFLGPLALERRQSQEDVDKVASELIKLIFPKRELGARQAQEDVDKVAKQLIDIIFSKRDLGARFDFSRPLNDVLGDFLGPLALERRQAQEDVDKVAKQLIDIIFSKRSSSIAELD